MKKLIAGILGLVMLISVLTGCSKPPEFAEIEARLAELIEASYGVNDVLFGEGLPTYERVLEDTQMNDIYYKNEETGKAYYYHYVEDETLGKLLAYRSVAVFGKYSYLQPQKEPVADKEAVYHDEKDGVYYYAVDYTPPQQEEKEYDFYYSEDDPADYDYVRIDAPYTSIDEIKAYAETVYGSEYLKSVYEMLFTGASISDEESGKLGARYYNYEDDTGRVWLMKSNRYQSLIRGKRIFDFSTAKVVRPGNKNFVNIEMETYLEQEPENRVTVRISMVYENGNWFLDSATY